ncbi:MAG: hypothetical protein Q9175_003165 [Cornicularia normoerica]
MIFGYSNEGLAGQSTQDNRPVSATGPMLKASPTGYPPNPHATETKAVIIRCSSSAHPVEGGPVWQSTSTSSFESRFHANDSSTLGIPTLVGLPLRMRSHSWSGTRGDHFKRQRERDREPRRAITVRETGGWQFRIRHNTRTERRQASRAQRWKTSTGAACDLSVRVLPRGGVGIVED